MAEFKLDEILKATDGVLIHGTKGVNFSGVAIDSRTINPGELFICIKGNNFDGHDFIQESVKNGAKGIIISRKDILEKKTGFAGSKDQGLIVILVKDGLDSLHGIANYHRKRFSILLIAVTGSNGKTISKEMIASVAMTGFNTLKSEGNLNNLIGLPLSLLMLTPQHEVVVLEMGMSAAGEIRRLCRIAEPNIGVITNIGDAHLEHLGSVEKVKEAKAELIDFLGKDDVVSLNADDPLVFDMAKRMRGRVITFGIDSEAAVRALHIDNRGLSGSDILLRVRDSESPVHLTMPGHHNIYNALSAAAVGSILDIGTDKIREGLESFRGMPMRMERIDTGGITIINDTYNANPVSMEAALRVIADSDLAGNSFFVAGDMLELGEDSYRLHRDIGRKVAEFSIDYLITVGELSQLIAEEAVAVGMGEDKVHVCKNHDAAFRILSERLKNGDCVLVKGSRGMKMEKVVEQLVHSEQD